MPHLLLSGFCNPSNPSTSHGMCRMPGCTCSCHQLAVDSGSAPRVKVSLSCLQGRHTATCGHLEPPVETTLDRLLDQPVPAGDTVTYERGGDPLTELAAARDAVDPHIAEPWVPNSEERLAGMEAAGHNHTWKLLPDPHGIYQGKAYVCSGPLGGGCGATMDDRSVYPFGVTPSPAVDGLEPPGVQTAIDDDLPLEVELTLEERRQVIAAHSKLHPDAALATTARLIGERLAAGTVTP